MKILFLVFSRQSSLKSFAKTRRTGFSWVDTLFEEFEKHTDVSVGIAVPVKDSTFSKLENGGFILYGLPEKSQGNKISQFIKRIEHKEIETDILSSAQKAIDDFCPDIIQIFGTENTLGEILVSVNQLVVIHFQGSLDIVARKWFSGVSKFELAFLGSLRNLVLFRGPYHEFFTFKKKALKETRIIQNCRFFIGRTDFDRQLLSLLSPSSKYFHCEEFIRPQFFLREWNRDFGNKLMFISILKGVTYKGLDVLFETSAALEKYTSLDFLFQICGIDKNEEIVRILKRKYKRVVDFSKFHFLGRIETASLVDRLCDSDIFIHPSYIENSSNSICEAMALGMPVIATNVGGTVSLLRDGVEGLLVQEGEPLSIAAAVQRMVQNSEYARSLARNARVRALERHNPEAIYNCLLGIYYDMTLT
jgi:glycosyltransferase involved in cell wall biosynthesis